MPECHHKLCPRVFSEMARMYYVAACCCLLAAAAAGVHGADPPPSNTVQDNHKYYTLSVFQNNAASSFDNNFIDMENAQLKHGRIKVFCLKTFRHNFQLSIIESQSVVLLRKNIRGKLGKTFSGRKQYSV